jgi:hypothetical protein
MVIQAREILKIARTFIAQCGTEVLARFSLKSNRAINKVATIALFLRAMMQFLKVER